MSILLDDIGKISPRNRFNPDIDYIKALMATINLANEVNLDHLNTVRILVDIFKQSSMAKSEK